MTGEGQRGGEVGGGGFYQSSNWSINSSMRLNSESKLFKLSACCFPTAPRTPAALGGNPLSPGVGGSGGQPRSFRRTDTGRFVLRHSSVRGDVPTQSRKITGCTRTPHYSRQTSTWETQRADTSQEPELQSQVTRKPPKLHTKTLTPRESSQRLRQLWTSGSWNIHQQKSTRNAPRLVSNFKLV